jgi:hypothetical protein
MALAATARGTGGNATAATSLTISPNAEMAIGSLAVLVIAYDNSGSSGADPYSSVADNAGVGHIWLPRHNTLRDPSTASSGCVLRIFTCALGAPLETTDTVTVTVSSSAVWAAALWEIVPDPGYTAAYASQATGAGNATTTPSATGPSCAVGDITIGGIAYEYGETTVTKDTDTTNGTWNTAQDVAFGSTTSGMNVCTQAKVQTTTPSTQTYNTTHTTSSDWAAGCITVTQIFGTRVRSGGAAIFQDPGAI